MQIFDYSLDCQFYAHFVPVSPCFSPKRQGTVNNQAQLDGYEITL